MPQHGKNGGNGAHGPNGGNGGEIATTPAAELAAPKLPDTWDQAKVDDILIRIENGELMTQACAANGIKPPTFRGWVLKDINGLAELYTRARLLRSEGMEEDILRAANDPDEDPNRSRVKIDALKWLMSRINPKKYGDRTDTSVNVGVGGTGTPIVVEINPFRGHRELMAERVPLNGGNGNGNGDGDGDDG